MNGQAIDRHLLGMKLAAIESGMKLHELFIDSSYQYALHYKLSTSQVMITYITAYSSLNFRTVSLVCVVCIISCSTLVLQQKTSGLASNHHDGGSWARISSRNLFFSPFGRGSKCFEYGVTGDGIVWWCSPEDDCFR